jgi:imidazolonepropionase-like amidohydrolase
VNNGLKSCRIRRSLTIASGLVLGLSTVASGAQEQITAIRAAKIIPVSGPEITNGVVLIKGTHIAAIGAASSVTIPDSAVVIQADVVMPGTVEAHTSRGMDAANENVAVVPFVTTADGIDPVNITFEDALRDGITTLQIIQGNNTVVGGTSIVVKPIGPTVETMLVKRPGAMKLSLAASGGRNRITQLGELKRAFEDYATYKKGLDERRAAAKKAGQPEEAIDPKQAAMQDLAEGRLKAFLYCPSDVEVLRAIEFVKAQKIKAVLVLGTECYRTAGAIAKAGLPVVLDPRQVTYETDEDQDKEIRHVLPLEYYRAGVKFALEAAPTAFGSRYLFYQAAQAVSFGVPRSAALRAITLTPAELIGVEDRVGSLQVGKDANLLLLTGDPLASSTWVDRVFIEGKMVYERKNDTRLQKLLTGKEPADAR